MGRFETTAEFYEHREPYPSEFFERLSAELNLTSESRLLDVACGPGNLAIGLAPFVGRAMGIDVEAEMLEAARLNSKAAGVNVDFEQVPVEELTLSSASLLGNAPVNLVTVGRALHWLEPNLTLAVFERIIEPHGCVAICSSTSSDSNAWLEGFQKVRRAWADGYHESHYRPDLDAWFAPSAFRKVREIAIKARHQVTVDGLMARALSYSVTSSAFLGAHRARFQAAVREELERFATGGMLEEEIVARAFVFSRAR